MIRDWLKTMRQRVNLTQGQVASSLGVSLRAVQQWESGDRDPSRDNVFALARVLGSEVLERFQEEWSRAAEPAPEAAEAAEGDAA